MSIKIVIQLSLCLFSFPRLTAAQDLNVKSRESKTPLLELYTSESCSSCPPADKWFSKLRTAKGLWQSFVPVVFHVDYWNHLNWIDELSSREMSQRQRSIASTWPRPSVYTPGVVLDGKEWQAWRGNSKPPEKGSGQPGVLELNCKARICAAMFTAKNKTEQKYRVHLAIVGFDIQSKVTSGENSGSLLTHDFSVLDWQSQDLDSSGKTEFKELKPKKEAKSYAIVSWVESNNSPIALQSVGGFLEQKPK